ncbi:MAG: hypothetical protein Q9219_003791 [cf. Caloplaca sp. 3 TL-2023]
MSTPTPSHLNTPSNHGPVVSVLTWFLLAATILAVIARVLTKFAISRRLTSDDFLVFAALALSIGQGIAVSVQTSNGVGQHQSALSSSQLDRYFKCDYASNLLFIFNLCLAKLSVLQMLRTITPVKQHVRMVTAVGGFVLLWSLLSAFVAAFQVFAGVVVQLIYVNRAKGSTDITFATWPVVLSAEIVQSFSIITACVPCLKPLLESLESGMLRSDDLRRRGLGGVYGYNSQPLSELSSSKSGGKKEKSSQFLSSTSSTRHFKQLPNVSTVVSVNRNEERERDSDSQKSSSRIIKYTRTWAVE